MTNIQTPLDLIAGMLRDAAGLDAGPGDDGAIHLQFDDELNVAVALSPDHADLVLYSVLGPATGRDGVVLITTALALNLHQVATRGGAIGLDTEHHTLVFSWRMRVAGTEPLQWMNAIEQFCITTRELHSQLRDAIGDLSEPELAALEERSRRESGLDETGTLESTDGAELGAPGESSSPAGALPPGLMIRA
jgi:hypothetical protein